MKKFPPTFDIVCTVISACLSTIIPATLLFVLNALIVYKIVASRRAVQTSGAMHVASSSASAASSKVASTTVMLFVESGIFLFLNLPYEVFVNYRDWHYGSLFAGISSCILFSIFDIAQLMIYTGSALNFILYMLTGRKFRKALLDTVCRRS